jgi:hypothetical protein
MIVSWWWTPSREICAGAASLDEARVWVDPRLMSPMGEPLTRRRFLVASTTLLLAARARVLDAAAKSTITVHKSPT